VQGGALRQIKTKDMPAFTPKRLESRLFRWKAMPCRSGFDRNQIEND